MGQELLVLGAEGAGKSLLIRRLKELCHNSKSATDPNVPSSIPISPPPIRSLQTGFAQLGGLPSFDPSESTIPTVGVNLSNLVISDIPLDVREIGSSMASRWDTFLPDCMALLFVVDASDLGQLSSTSVLLYEILSNREFIIKKPIAILFNKLDLVGDPRVTLPIIYNTLRIDDLLRRNKDWSRLVVLAGSSLDVSGATVLRKWILSFLKDK